jgi:hypothetical protein
MSTLAHKIKEEIVSDLLVGDRPTAEFSQVLDVIDNAELRLLSPFSDIVQQRFLNSEACHGLPPGAVRARTGISLERRYAPCEVARVIGEGNLMASRTKRANCSAGNGRLQ